MAITESDGTKWLVQLSGIRLLRANDFREGNIILSCEIVTGEPPPRSWVERLVMAPRADVAAEHHDSHRRQVDELVAGITDGGLTFVLVSPSYGCELMAICEVCSGTEVG